MSRKRFLCLSQLLVSIVLFSLIACQSKPQTESNAAPAPASGPECKKQPFTYDDGPLGQKHWCGECNDAETKVPQAPINIIRSDAKPDDLLPTLNFSSYRTTKLVTTNDKHTLKVTYENAKEKSLLSVGGKMYTLEQFHFHHPGEEAIDNHRPAMVIHLVHNEKESIPGGPVAIAIMVEEGKPDSKTAMLVNKLIEHFPPPDGPQGGEAGVDINAADLLPAGSFPVNHSYYRYTGSLTTPGCDGPVTFYVLKTPVIFAPEQIRQFERHYPFPNARNIQPAKGRVVEQTLDKHK
jgi:carbonic anhydrase